MKTKKQVTCSLIIAFALTLSGAVATSAHLRADAVGTETNVQTFDFTTVTSFDDLNMFSVGIDPKDNSETLGYTSDSWVTYAKEMSDLFTLENGLKVNTSAYSGDDASENRIYVRYNVETMKYFSADLTYSYDDTARFGWAGLILGYTNYERQARWADSPYGAEFFVQNEGKGTYATSKINSGNYVEGATPDNWTANGEHTLSIVADENGIVFSADGTVVNSLTTAELETSGYALNEGSVGFMLTNAQFTVKSFSVTDLSPVEETYLENHDFTAATIFDDLSMFSVGIDPKDNSETLGYTSDSWVTYAKEMSDLFTLENGLKVNTSAYSGDDASENRIYVRYNAKTMQYFKAELTYSYDDTARFGWAGFILGYTNYERRAHWGDSPYGAEFFVQNEGNGTYSASKLNESGYTEGTAPDSWTKDGEHTLKIVAIKSGITLYADGTQVVSISEADMLAKGYELTPASIGFMFTNAQFTAKSFNVSPLNAEGGEYVEEETGETMLNVLAQTNDEGTIIRFVSAVDSLDYAKAGFEISVTVGGEAKTVTVEITKVYETLLAKGEKFDSSVFGVENGYLFAYAVSDVPSTDTEFTVRAYVVTNDGETLWGQQKVLKTADGLNA